MQRFCNSVLPCEELKPSAPDLCVSSYNQNLRTFSSCFFPRVQLSTPKGRPHRSLLLKGQRQVLLDTAAATCLISSNLVDKL